MGNTSSKGPFSIAKLDYRSVIILVVTIASWVGFRGSIICTKLKNSLKTLDFLPSLELLGSLPLWEESQTSQSQLVGRGNKPVLEGSGSSTCREKKIKEKQKQKKPTMLKSGSTKIFPAICSTQPLHPRKFNSKSP